MKLLARSLRIFIFLTVLTGFLYPLIVTGVVHILFPFKANGSIIIKDSKKTGSELVGQEFTDPKYFFSRPSHISYNPLPSGGSNLALTNQKLRDLVFLRTNEFTISNRLDSVTVIPSEMLFASASGLDPHITPEAARLQVDRIVDCRNFSSLQKKEVLDIIENHIEEPQFHLLGVERINVFLLNLSLDTIR